MYEAGAAGELVPCHFYYLLNQEEVQIQQNPQARNLLL